MDFRGFKLGVGRDSPEAGWRMPVSRAETADFEGDKLTFVPGRCGPGIQVMLDAHLGNRPGGTTGPVVHRGASFTRVAQVFKR